MKYYILDYEINNSRVLIDKYKFNNKDLFFDLFEGEKLDIINPVIHCKMNINSELTDLIDSSQLIVSKKLLDCIINIDKNIDFFEITIEPKIDNKYYLVNILNNISAIDYNKSKIKFFEDTEMIEEISGVYLVEEKINGRNLFRLNEINTKIVVSEEAKNKMDVFSGVVFIPLKDYNEGIY